MKPFQLWHSVSVIQRPNTLLFSPLACSLFHRFCNKNKKLIICENNVNIFHLNISLIINAFSTFIWCLIWLSWESMGYRIMHVYHVISYHTVTTDLEMCILVVWLLGVNRNNGWQNTNDSRLLFMHTGVQRNFYIRWYPCRLTVTSPRTTYLPWVPPYFHSFEMINFIECKTNLYKILCNVLFFKFYCALWLYECWKLKFTPGYNVDRNCVGHQYA
jgi:hypothetical protein